MWIKCEEKMPRAGTWVLGFLLGEELAVVLWDSIEWQTGFKNCCEAITLNEGSVTHWKKLPNHPKDE